MLDTNTKYTAARKAIESLRPEEYDERSEYWAEFFSRALNGTLSLGDGERIGKHLTTAHRYLQSQVIQFCLKIVTTMARQVYWDGRNAAALNAAVAVADLMQDDSIWQHQPRYIIERDAAINGDRYWGGKQAHGWTQWDGDAVIFTQRERDLMREYLMPEGGRWKLIEECPY
jgi:hypothetical protein